MGYKRLALHWSDDTLDVRTKGAMRTTNEVLIKRYLLGDMPHEERVRFEDRCFADADMFEEFLGTENELVDSFARGKLSESEEQQFERNYCVSPKRREKVEFAKALAKVVQHELRASSTTRLSLLQSFLAFFRVPGPNLRWASVAVATLLIAGVLGLALQDDALRGELQQAKTAQERLRKERDGLREQIKGFEDHNQQIPGSEQGNQVARLWVSPDLTFTLIPGTERGFNVAKKDLVIPPGPWIRLEMPLVGDEYISYEAVLLDSELHEVRRGKTLKSVQAGKAVIWRLSSDAIKSGDYLVELIGKMKGGGTEKVQAFSFRIIRR